MRLGSNQMVVMLTLSALFLFSGGAFAQETTAVVYGAVTADGPLPGVMVTIDSPNLLAQQVRYTNEQGNWRFPALPVGTYTITLSLQGFRQVVREGILLSAGTRIGVNVTLELSSIEETITVVGLSPLVDVKSAKTMRTLTEEVIKNIPRGRRYDELLTMMPGVIDSEYGFTPAQSVHGSTPRENLYNVDGAGMNDTTVGYALTELPLAQIQEVQVTTGGISAEFGLASGALFNIITKSGGNEFHGEGNYYFQGEGIEWGNLSPELKEQIPQGTSTVKFLEYGGSLGGPIWRNRAWFFSNIRWIKPEQRQPDFTAVNPTKDQLHAFVKGTVQVTPDFRLQASLTTRDQDHFPSNPSFRNEKYQEVWNRSLRTQRIVNITGTHVFNDNTYMEGRFSGAFKHFESERPYNPDSKLGYFDVSTRESFGGLTGIVSETFARDMREVKFSLSHFRDNWAGGAHDLKVGGGWELGIFDDEDGFPNGDDVVMHLFDGEAYRVRQYLTPARVTGKITIYHAYLQDQWTIGDRVTLNIGARWEGTEGWAPAQGAGPSRWFPEVSYPEFRDIIGWSNVAPRLGVNVALDESYQTSLKFSFSRYYQRLLNQHNLIVLPNKDGYLEYGWNDLNGDLLFQAGEQVGSPLRNTLPVDPANVVFDVDPGIRQPYTDAVHISLERELAENWLVSVTGIYKEDHDIIDRVDSNFDFDDYLELSIASPVDGSPVTIFYKNPALAGVRSRLILTNPGTDSSDPMLLYRNYKGLEFSVARRMSDNWMMSASYNWSKSYGTKGNSYGSSWGGVVYNDPNRQVNAEGPLDMDIPHQFKLMGTFVAPYEVVLGAYLQILSGFPIKPPENFPSDPVLGSHTIEVRGRDHPEIVIESTILQAAFPRGTFRFDTQFLANFRAEKRFDIKGTRVRAVADLFNITNANYVTAVQSMKLGRSNFLTPARIQSPRIVRLGLIFEF